MDVLPAHASEWLSSAISQVTASPTFYLSITLAVYVVVLLVFKYARFKYRVWSRHPAVPCPPPTFPFGSAGGLSNDYLGFVEKLCNEFSSEDGVASLFVMSDQIFMVWKHEHMKQVFMNSTYRRPFEALKGHFDVFLGKRALTSLMKEEWVFHRKLMQQAFKFAELQRMAVTMVDCTSHLCNDWLKLKADTKEPVEMFSTLKALTFDVIGRTAFGYDFQAVKNLDTGLPRVAKAFAYLLTEYSRRVFSPDPRDWFYWTPFERNRQHQTETRILRHTVNSVIAQRRAAGSQDNEEDFLKHMLAAHDDESGQKLDDEALVDNIVTLMFGGFDTTSILLTFALWLISGAPDVERKLQEESDLVYGNRLPTYADASSLVYTQMVVKETLRLFPSAPLTTRTLESDIQFGNTKIKAGQDVWVPLFYAQRHPYNYPDRPDQFIPERWDQNAKTEIPASAWVPFAMGARVCIGQKFAMLEATLSLSLIMHNFRFARVPGYKFKAIHAGVVQIPEGGMPLLVQSRKH